jgi:ATP-dependent DNA helicase RecG
MQWLKGKLNIRYEIEGGGPRKEHWEIPETALKEAIINSIGHRDYYDKGARIHIELYDDRLKISNPGGLTSAITPKEFGTKSHSRNPLIFGLLVRVRLVEQLGSGIGRINTAIKEAGLSSPEFKTDGLFTVVFKREKSSVKSREKSRVKSRVKIIDLMGKFSSITITELAIKVGISIKAIEKQINQLKKENIIKRIGPDNGGHWMIVNKSDNEQ